MASQVLLLSGCAGLLSSSGKGTTLASFQLSPASISFGQVAVGKQATQVITVSNIGTAALNLTQVKVSNSQFSVPGMSLPMALAVGQTGSITVAVNPTSAGTVTGTLSAQGDSGSSPVVVSLSATAVSPTPQLSVSPTSIEFGSVSDGLKNNTSLVLSNLGSANLTISMITISGAEFAISGISTPATISAGQSVTAVVAFSPTAAGGATGNVSVTSNDPVNPTMNVPLSGTGSTTASGQLSASPASLSFGTVGVGSPSNQSIQLTNTGNAAVHITSLSVGGTGFSSTGVTAPATLNPSQSATLAVTFDPTTAGNATGLITILSDASNSTFAIPLSGLAAQPGLAVSPASFGFGSVVDGQTKSQKFTVTNTGTAALTIAQLSVTGAAYSVSGLSTPATLAPGASATFSVLFAPTTAGSLSGSISITSNASSSPNTASFSGIGIAGTVSLSSTPTSLSFPNVNAGSSSSTKVTITNTGNTSLTISGITVSAKDFSVSGISAPSSLASGQNAVMNVTFNPKASEQVTGNVTVTTSEGMSDVITVSGIGVQPGLTITPQSASFGNVSVGSPSTQTIQLTNSGTGTLTITQVGVAGSGFSTSTLALPLSLNPGQSSNFNVQFTPASAGTDNGSVSIVSNAPNSPATFSMSGTGIAATELLSFSTSSLGFGNVNAGSSSTQTVTVTNTGNANVTISQITESGAGFSLTGAGTPVTLSPAQTLTFSIIFSPTTAGNLSGTVTVSSTATGSPKTIALSGSGVQVASHSVTLSWTASTSTVSGYNVYRSTTSGSGYAKINSGLVGSVTYSDTTVQNGSTYYYVTTAVDSSGDESSYSNQATAVIPAS